MSRLPLAGVRVVVTRSAHQAEGTVAAFGAAGADVERLPLLEVVPPDDPRPLTRALDRLAGFDWIVFTSANAVDAALGRLDGALPATVHAAAIGEATAQSLRARGVEPALVAERSRGEGLAEELLARLGGDGARTGSGIRVLLPQAADARPALGEILAHAGVAVERVAAYAKRVPPGAAERAAEIFGTSRFGWVTFTSPSLARAFAELWGSGWAERRLGLFAASIGPVTSAALEALGAPPAAEAAAPGDAELVAAVVQALAAHGLGRA